RTYVGPDVDSNNTQYNNINNVVVVNNIPSQDTQDTLEIQHQREKEETASPGEGDQGEHLPAPEVEGRHITRPEEGNAHSFCSSSETALQIQQAFTKVTGRSLDGKALEELANYPLEYVLAKIAMVESGKDKINAPGWLIEACREDYQHLPVKGKKKKAGRKSPLAPRLPDTSQDDKYRELYRLD
ncbi:MAG: hypothetical protein ACPLQP_07445, partial [Moorellaceae bacterium]